MKCRDCRMLSAYCRIGLNYNSVSFVYFVGVMRFLISTSKTLAISFSCCIGSCTLLAHHLETVFSDLPSCSDSQRLVFPCSAKAAFSRFSITFCWLFDIILWLFCCKYTKLFPYFIEINKEMWLCYIKNRHNHQQIALYHLQAIQVYFTIFLYSFVFTKCYQLPNVVTKVTLR